MQEENRSASLCYWAQSLKRQLIGDEGQVWSVMGGYVQGETTPAGLLRGWRHLGGESRPCTGMGARP